MEVDSPNFLARLLNTKIGEFIKVYKQKDTEINKLALKNAQLEEELKKIKECSLLCLIAQKYKPETDNGKWWDRLVALLAEIDIQLINM